MLAEPTHRHCRAEQLAFWINAYNAYTIRRSAHHERSSIKNINKSGGLGGAGRKMATIGGTGIRVRSSMNALPGLSRAARAFRAGGGVTSASAEQAYRAADLEQQLDDRLFPAPRAAKNRVDAAKKTVWLSPIFCGTGGIGRHDAALQQALRDSSVGAERDLLTADGRESSGPTTTGHSTSHQRTLGREAFPHFPFQHGGSGRASRRLRPQGPTRYDRSTGTVRWTGGRWRRFR
jgi:hypothetical protein